MIAFRALQAVVKHTGIKFTDIAAAVITNDLCWRILLSGSGKIISGRVLPIISEGVVTGWNVESDTKIPAVFLNAWRDNNNESDAAQVP